MHIILNFLVFLILVACVEPSKHHLTFKRGPLFAQAPGHPSQAGEEMQAKGFQSSEVIPLTGGISKAPDYIAPISIGTPPVQFLVTLDTGSTDLGVTLDTCDQCYAADQPYSPSASSTSVQKKCGSPCLSCYGGYCNAKIGYEDGTGACGALYQDKVGLGGLSADALFIGFTAATSSFPTKGTDGIMGLAFRSISAGGEPSVLDTIVETNNLSNVFSLCLGDLGGKFIIGDVDSDYYIGNIHYTPLRSSGEFAVDLLSISVTGSTKSPIVISNMDVFVDSGTTLLIVPVAIQQQIISDINTWCSSNSAVSLFCGPNSILNVSGSASCLTFNESQLSSGPNISFTFPGKNSGEAFTVDLTPRDYIRYESLRIGKAVCGIFSILADSQLGNTIILGDTFMKAFYVVFDKQNQQVGFAYQNGTSCSPFASELPQMNSKTHSENGVFREKATQWKNYQDLSGGYCNVSFRWTLKWILLLAAAALGLLVLLVLCCACCIRVCCNRRRTGYQQIN